MSKKLLSLLLSFLMVMGTVCLAEETPQLLPDGVYTADFSTDSGMFRLNETCEGKGTLTVIEGRMTIHITLLSQNFLNAFAGTAEEASQEDAVIIEPSLDEVTYPDGLTETVHGFDIPVPALNQDFTIAVVGKKGVWYSHTVSVTNPETIGE